jgi:hypothetical protein
VAEYDDPIPAPDEDAENPASQGTTQEQPPEEAMAAGEVLARLAEQARGTLEDFLRMDQVGNHAELRIAADRQKLHLLKTLRPTARGPVLELYNAQAALVVLGRCHGLFLQSGPAGSGDTPTVRPRIHIPDNGREPAAASGEW